ncbi:ABC transporter ATP-binding protein [Thalassobacillus devorans]|uniref:ABC transporter ATP-binding protein n=1 Tax=Thalassobacillus devorans TaxID=279813 RepID=A0ABQ1P6F1_9BACI|nr:ABC transporter ATP-binding protein [Thalassobacillus devorans]NIK29556.1 ABC-2 type transport system ATP-binding protein [Thalassobacillus devorans]GGC90994.1 ABC transporter ATP-binding protein [Thalassobacillus devorans]
MIELRGVEKSFQNQRVLNDITLQIKTGSIYGLLGSNGAGKTTLLKVMAGILKQEEGSVQVNEAPVFENPEVKNKMVFIPDRLYFFPHYTIEQMSKFYQNIYSGWDQPRFEELKNIFGLDIKKKVSQFSKGMQRQVAFWLALSAMPDILVLDEPFDGLDPVVRKKVKNLLIRDVAERQMTIVISSHNLREVEDICDYVGIIHNGDILLEKDLDDLKADIHKVQAAFRNHVPAKLKQELTLLHEEKRGSVRLWIVRGKEEVITEKVGAYNPVVFDLLPLTLEEIFIYEMGGVGYNVENILV